MLRFWLRVAYPLSLGIFAVALSLEVSLASSFAPQPSTRSQQLPLNPNNGHSWQISQAFQPPDRGAPPRTEDLGTRGGLLSQKPLTVLMPDVKPQEPNFGLTLSAYPTFFAYIPESSAETGLFVLIDDNEQIVYRESFPMPQQAGIVSISLPHNASPALEMDRWYQWYVIVVDNPDHWSNNGISNRGWIQRIKPNETLENQLQNATPRELPTLYAEAGIWHDAVASLITLRDAQPDNPILISDWKKLFDSAGLAAFSQDSVVDCCKAEPQ